MTVKWWHTETAADLPVIARSVAPAQLDTQGIFHHFVKHVTDVADWKQIAGFSKPNGGLVFIGCSSSC